MTDAEKVLRGTLKEYFERHSVKVKRLWREKRKKPHFIAGRQLKLRVIGLSSKDIDDAVVQIKDYFGYVCAVKIVSLSHQAYIVADISITQTKNSLQVS